MTKRAIVLILFAVVLGGVGLAAHFDWFRHPEIRIIKQIRPPSRRVAMPAGDTPVYPVMFAFDRPYRLTDVKVVAVEDEKTNKFPHVLWHMISDSNSIPTKALAYGARVSGMKPKVPRAQPDPLEPEVGYHLYLEAGSAKGDVKFQTHELVKPTAQ